MIRKRAPLVFGSDIGGVIIDRHNHPAADDPAADAYLRIPEIPGALRALALLRTKSRFGQRIFFVSRSRNEADEFGDRAWLAHRHLIGPIGVPPTHVHFCAQREDKDDVCADLGVTHFVDDRLDVLAALRSVQNRYLFRPVNGDVRGAYRIGARPVSGWDELIELLLPLITR